MSATTVRERLFEAVQAEAHSDDDLEGAVLVGFMVVAEWRAPGGDQWISKVSGDHSAALPSWRERGLAAEVLHDWWAGNDDENQGDDGEGGSGS